MIPWSFCWNNIRLRPLRILLTILSIAGGVASVVAVLQSAAATRNQLASLHQTLDSRVAMEVVSSDSSAFAIRDAPKLDTVPGIQFAVPTYRVFALIYSGRRHVRGIVTGVDLEQYRNLLDLEIVSGRICTEPEEVCLEASAAEHLKVRVGDLLQLRVRGRRWLIPRTVTGIIKPTGLGAVQETATLFMPRAAAGKLEYRTDFVSSLQITLVPGADPPQVASSVRSLLPSHLKLVNSTSSASLSGPTEALVNIALNVAACLSVVAAIFIVINTFQISVAERKRQLALLRIVGATTDQVRVSIYQEACLLGGVGTLLGCGLGVALSSLLAQGVQTLFGLTQPVVVAIRPSAILTGLIFGMLVTLVSVWFPAQTVCDLPPLQVLKSATAPNRSIGRRVATRWAITTFLGFGLMYSLVALGVYPGWTAIFGIGLLLISSTIFLPSLIRPGCALLTRLVGWSSPMEFQLGQSQLLDNFGRTALTIMVMFVVSATSISIAITTLSVTADVEAWLDRTLTSDYLLRASKPRVDMPEADSLPDDLDARLRLISGISSIDRMAFSLASIEGRSATLLTRQIREYETLPIDLIEGDAAALRSRLMAGEAVIGSVLARRLHLHEGDSVRIEIGGIGKSIRVAGIAKEYTSSGLMIIMDQAAARDLFPLRDSQVYGIRTERAASEQVGQALRAIAKERGLIFQSLSDLRELIRTMISGLTSRLWVILLLALVIAGFAIVNTLTMSVIQQTRQLGVLRVVGMTRLQVIRMFLLQALTMGLLALVPGTAIGVVLAYLITHSFRGVSDHGVALTVNPLLVTSYLVSGVFLSILAALLPAIRAGRLNPLEAIHEE